MVSCPADYRRDCDTTTSGDVMESTFLVTLNSNRWRGCSAVWPDRQEMARLAVELLVGLGHRRFGMLGYPVPSHDMTTADANARTGRMNKELKKFGLALDMHDVHLCSTPETAGSADAMGLERSFDKHCNLGDPCPSETRRMIGLRRDALRRLQERQAERKVRIEKASARLAEEIARIVKG